MPTVAANGIDVYYEESGQGQPLLLIMGLGAQMIFWDQSFIDGLVAHGYRVIAFDNRDVGLSSHLHDLPVPNWRRMLPRAALRMAIDAPYSLDDMAEDGFALLDALGVDRTHVLGVSMGGMIAQLMALKRPERVRTLTSIMSHPGDALSQICKPRALRSLFRPMARDRSGAIERYLDIRRALRGPGFPFDEVVWREKAGRAYDRGAYPRGFLRQLAAIAAAENRIPALRSCLVPTLVVHGTHDPLVRPRGGRQTARALPDARLYMVPGMGHELPPAVQPTVVRKVAQLGGMLAR